MAVYPFRTSNYGKNIYLYGNTTFSAIHIEYHEPVKEYVAKTFTKEQIDNALTQNWITQTEYDETIALIPA